MTFQGPSRQYTKPYASFLPDSVHYPFERRVFYLGRESVASEPKVDVSLLCWTRRCQRAQAHDGREKDQKGFSEPEPQGHSN